MKTVYWFNGKTIVTKLVASYLDTSWSHSRREAISKAKKQTLMNMNYFLSQLRTNKDRLDILTKLEAKLDLKPKKPKLAS